jgi:predicted transposase YbfD/YdcC
MHYILKKTLHKIIRCGHDYVAQVKANQKELLKWVEFNTSIDDAKPIDSFISYEHNTHGRHEERICEIYDDLYQIKDNWKSVKRVIKITSTTLSYGKCSIENHYYISSLKVDAKTFAHIIRSHWKIENSLHYVKDVSFDEDSSRIRTDQAPLVSTMIRSLAINIMNINKILNIKKARKLFGWSPHRLFNLSSGLK